MKGIQFWFEDFEQDVKWVDWLWNDEKNCVENLMIVDLLCNDISWVVEIGFVEVLEFFKIESYVIVYQMVFLVCVKLCFDVGLGDIFKVFFFCGLIIGVLKLCVMEIICELEFELCEIYCGGIGWVVLDGCSNFNVVICILMVEDGLVKFNVGGGVVWDSIGLFEYEEVLWKVCYVIIFCVMCD